MPSSMLSPWHTDHGSLALGHFRGNGPLFFKTVARHTLGDTMEVHGRVLSLITQSRIDPECEHLPGHTVRAGELSATPELLPPTMWTILLRDESALRW